MKGRSSATPTFLGRAVLTVSVASKATRSDGQDIVKLLMPHWVPYRVRSPALSICFEFQVWRLGRDGLVSIRCATWLVMRPLIHHANLPHLLSRLPRTWISQREGAKGKCHHYMLLVSFVFFFEEGWRLT